MSQVCNFGKIGRIIVVMVVVVVSGSCCTELVLHMLMRQGEAQKIERLMEVSNWLFAA